MTDWNPVVGDVGKTHASSVIPVVKSRELESLIVTQSLTPLNDRALPNLPAVVRVAPEIVPGLPVPDASRAVAPVVSSKLNAATSPFSSPAGPGVSFAVRSDAGKTSEVLPTAVF